MAPLRSIRSATKSLSSLIAASRGLEVFAEQRLVQGLGALVVLHRTLQSAAERVERFLAARLSGVQPSVEHEVGEFALLVEAAEDRPTSPTTSSNIEIFSSSRCRICSSRVPRGDEVEHEDFALLADAIDASDALLDRHRIPRHVEIDQRVAELDVAAFAAGFGTQEHRHPVAER